MEIVLGGGPALRRDNRFVALPRIQRRQVVLAFGALVVERRRPMSADELAEWVWPAGPPAEWRSGLRRILSEVRTLLAFAGIEPTALHARLGTYRLALPDGVTVDTEEVERRAAKLEIAWADGRLDEVIAEGLAIEAATETDVLPSADAPWVDRLRNRQSELRSRALRRLAEALLRSGRAAEAMRAVDALLERSPFDERAHQLGLEAARFLGRQDVVAQRASTYRTAMSEFGIGVALEEAETSRVTGHRGDVLNALEKTKAAMRQLSFAEAEATAERALRLLRIDTAQDHSLEAETLSLLGQARWADRGDTDGVRRAALDAAERALHVMNGDTFADAISVALTTTGVGRSDPSGAALCRRALLGFSVADRRARAYATAFLAEDADGDRSIELAEAAVALAEESGDAGALLDALHTLDQSLAWSPSVDRRLEVARRIDDVALTTPRWRYRPSFEVLTRVQLGHVDWLLFEAERQRDVAEKTGQWEPASYATTFRATHALVTGDVTTCAALADELLTLNGGETNGLNIAAALHMLVARERGGIEELLPLIRDIAAQHPNIATYAAANALGLALTGQTDRARDAVAVIVDKLDDVPRDHVWPVFLGLLAEAAALTRHAPSADAVFAQLEPYTGLLCAGAHAAVVLGAVDRYLGGLSLARGQTAEAVDYLEAALEFETGVGAPLFAARTKAWLAAALREAKPDDKRAAALFEEAWQQARGPELAGLRLAVGQLGA
jgi:DNA-binding SARP family transcriptional activator